MDEATFQKELAKYKVIRKADHYKIRINTSKNEVKSLKAGVRKDVTKTKTTTTTTNTTTAATNDFWDLLANSITNLTVKEKADFIKALKEEHQVVNERINIDDLEAIASSLK
jgi:hypothetical protein